jgi:hypothetical protein
MQTMKILGCLVLMIIIYAWPEQIPAQEKIDRSQPILSAIPPTTNFVRPIRSDRKIVLEDYGIIRIVHGTTFGKSEFTSRIHHLEMNESFQLPDFAHHAIVILNGWRLKYLSGNAHVNELTVYIVDAELEGRNLNWNVRGMLSDDSGDDAYELEYDYIVIAWNKLRVDARTEQNLINADIYKESPPTAIHYLASYYQNSKLPGKPNAILPQGFRFEFSSESGDHHLLQIGYNLDHHEASFASDTDYQYLGRENGLPNGLPRLESDILSWVSYGIFKDDDSWRDYRFVETTCALWGKDIGIFEPPFAIIPREDHEGFGSCLEHGGGETEEVVIENVPFDYAVPVLTGWELSHKCNDYDVREVGIWLSDIEYEKLPQAPTGTLRYKVSSRFSEGGHARRHKVSILGLGSEGFVFEPPPDELPPTKD